MLNKLNRLLDANINRCMEGLRVCEDISRFAINDKNTTKRFKAFRHKFFNCLGNGSFDYFRILRDRDSRFDVGKESLDSELTRKGIDDIFFANSRRAKESLRVLEELFKLIDIKASGDLKALRFELYTLEKDAAKKLETLCDN